MEQTMDANAISPNKKLLLLFLSFCLFISSTSGNSPTLGAEKQPVRAVTMGARRLVEQDHKKSTTLSLLAEQRTSRKDPLDDFKRYNGGWNITNNHYWASVGYTAAPFFVISIFWFNILLIILCLVCLSHFCCPREPFGYSTTAYALSPNFLIFFNFAAIVGIIVLLTGQAKFHSGTTNALNYAVNQADSTVGNLRNVSNYLVAAKKIEVDALSLPANVEKKIDKIKTKIESSATRLSHATTKNSKSIQAALKEMRLLLIIVVVAMILLAILGSLFSFLGMQVCVYLLVIVGWILCAFAFMLCGAFLVLHNAVGDGCVAVDEWIQNPTSHTALDNVIPCADNVTAQKTVSRAKDVTFRLVTVVNHAITTVSNVNTNQSVIPVPLLCNPFNSNLIEQQCASHEVSLQNATQVWKSYVSNETAPGRLSPKLYGEMEEAVKVSNGLYESGNKLLVNNVQGCTFVREMSKNGDYCGGLQKYSSWIYIGLAMAAAALTLSMIFWVIYGRERRHHLYIQHHFMDRAMEEFQEQSAAHLKDFHI